MHFNTTFYSENYLYTFANMMFSPYAGNIFVFFFFGLSLIKRLQTLSNFFLLTFSVDEHIFISTAGDALPDRSTSHQILHKICGYGFQVQLKS